MVSFFRVPDFSCTFECGFNTKSMRKEIYAGFVLCLMLPGGVCAQRYKLAGVKAGRYEVTRSLDSRPDSGALRVAAPFREAVDSMRAPVLGESEVAMRADRPESLLSNFVADVLRDASVRVGKRADIGLCNIGGLRSAMPKGKVTYGDVLEIAPFENRLCVLTLTGSKLKELMDQIAAVGGEGVSGVRMAITMDGRLLTVEVNGKPIEEHALYTIATLDYLAEGNDRMYALKDNVYKAETKIAVRDLIVEAILRAQAEGRKVTAKMEGRITKQ